jgi:NAD(P)-dependent dehydrogenase (short-subunit alcohol dehydrogenase family)
MGERVKGKVVIVTGAGSVGPGWGNGKAAAVLYAREGATVLAVDLRPAAAEETQAIIAAEGGTCLVYAGDVASNSDVEAMVAACVGAFGRVDVLHNNVGIVALGGPVETSEAAWDRAMRVNVTSMFLTCKYVLPHMVAQFERDGRGGAIVNIGSIAGIRWTGTPYVAYAASKAAVSQFSKAVAVQYAAKGIRCNTILLGFMDTPFIVELINASHGADEVPTMIERRHAQSLTGRMGDAWDVAYAALFLASDEAKYITGVDLLVDGGVSLCTPPAFPGSPAL